MTAYHWISIGLFGTFALLEAPASARAFPLVPRWRLKGFAFTVLYFAVATFAPLAWDGFLGQYQLLDATGLPFVAQIALGFGALQLGIYVWHRSMHNSDLLWRVFHQTHHSAERVDLWGAFYFHPLDMVGWAFIGSLALILGVGISGEAGFVVAVFVTALAMFQHSNLRTPRWIGFLIVRPESHAVHHERGVHAFNYCDFPLIDMLFGTFRNPREWTEEAGFYDGASSKLGALLTFRKPV
ncbi:sterol desaturase family protein [Erythrobacter sp.]|jgi:sterol desaturase/sphingolipid hydroxylase (fatty acid hydroxylase superfamily)|uniref:sterol desaturase family protein n=1 Tax=Erythrobacter sp. TaxID=1042 RepID=UPI002EB3CA10|nr:sterol desaturase family protein [Erythrobacter sp.]